MPLGYISALDSPALQASGPRPTVLLGATGSIGVSALKVVEEHPNEFTVLGLAGARNVTLLAQQATRWRPPLLAVLNDSAAAELKALLPAGYSPDILTGPQGYIAMATAPQAALVLSAQVGAAGLPSTLAAAKAGKCIALANKESLVLAGDLIRQACKDSGAVILPVDSEHNALFQALIGHGLEDGLQDVEKLILTASGGPFRGRSAKELESMGPEDALKHPNWSMGAKISIDSATLMNKGLEFIEAFHLYGLAPERIEVIVHPQSIVHSLVEYHDGSLLAHLGPADMRIAIAYCFSYPRRLPLGLNSLDLISLGNLTFEPPDVQLFPCLRLAMEALAASRSQAGGKGHTVVLNAANEVAVACFLERKIGFQDIPRLVERALEAYEVDGPAPMERLDDILALDQETRRRTARWTGKQD